MPARPLPSVDLESLVKTAFAEDAPFGDITTRTLIDPHLCTHAQFVAKQRCILAGVAILDFVYQVVDPKVVVTATVEDGDSLHAGSVFATLHGPAGSILTGERVALNFLQHLSGVATLTAQFCAAVRDYPTTLLDTRKTIPGLRQLEKWAVSLGGGTNHRLSLSDGLLIKDNHLALLGAQGTTLRDACRIAKERGPHHLHVCVEVETLEQVAQALDGGADVLLLDNMLPSLVQEAVGLIKRRAGTEVSGGVTLQNVREYAATGVDSISIGALTHSAPAVDISLNVIPPSSQPFHHSRETCPRPACAPADRHLLSGSGNPEKHQPKSTDN